MLETVQWDILAAKACRLLQAGNAKWGEHTRGAYNLVRFLHLDDTVIVARVPLEWKMSPMAVHRMESEIATMEYVREHTKIPVPRVLDYNTSGEDIGVPYMLMSKADGVPLSSVWDVMEDEKREKVFQQVVEILLDLAEQRFDKMGALFRQGSGWELRSQSEITENEMDTVTFTNGVSYWVAVANAYMDRICNENFGAPAKEYQYAQGWFMRSLIPGLYDPVDDRDGFPLCPGDFHSQNILVDGFHITAILDWERSGTCPFGSFAIYPFFIVDHPMWDTDNPLRARNVRDQATFNSLMRTAESRRNTSGTLPLSEMYETCQGRYLFEQAIQFPGMYSVIYPLLFAHIFGEEEEDEPFSVQFYLALLDIGVLRKKSCQFAQETKLLQSVRRVLGEDCVYRGIDRKGFKDIVSKHINRLGELDLNGYRGY